MGVTAGFPAHAGMDPSAPASAPTRTWFPRPRGDGPLDVDHHVHHQRVSPPTRGWTPAEDPHPPWRAGFPAHAGMDLTRRHMYSSFWRFPRPRGDGPEDGTAWLFRHTVSPPTRGWTPAEGRFPAGRRGFPAHAGMDLRITGTATLAEGFPRPRGDGPAQSPPVLRAPSVSPPTRGWTSYSTECLDACVGFPAHAGMDRPGGARPKTSRRFPRPRGDGPSSYTSRCANGSVSPPTRGWTLPEGVEERPEEGFPAHAGMDPSRK